MSIADGMNLIEWEGGLFEPGSDLLARTRWAFAYIRDRGGSIILNEAGRPFGVYSDRFARNSVDTESGRSTVNFQWGRYLRGETPSAANPAGGIYASEHTRGLATDTNANPTWLRSEAFALVGMENTIASESWHWAIRSAPQVDITGWAELGSTPFDNSADELAAVSELQKGESMFIIFKQVQSGADDGAWALGADGTRTALYPELLEEMLRLQGRKSEDVPEFNNVQVDRIQKTLHAINS